MRNKWWTRLEIEILEKRYRDGNTIPEIARYFGEDEMIVEKLLIHLRCISPKVCRCGERQKNRRMDKTFRRFCKIKY